MLKNFFVVAYLKLTDTFVTRTTTSFFEYKISHQKFTLILYGINNGVVVFDPTRQAAGNVDHKDRWEHQ